MIVAQLTDTHIVREGETYFALDTARYLVDAIAALHALDPLPDCVVVTGDLVNAGHAEEYLRFRNIMRALRVPYYVIPGNHDQRDRMRDVLAPATYGGSRDATVRYVVDDFAVRLIGIDANVRPWPGAALAPDVFVWLERELAAAPDRPAIVCVHQPPFRTGLQYLDALGFRGARRLRSLVERFPAIGRVVSGHIHCTRSSLWGRALALSAPSTAPQVVPELFAMPPPVRLRREVPGFALHAWQPGAGFSSTIYRRDAAGGYSAMEHFADPVALSGRGSQETR